LSRKVTQLLCILFFATLLLSSGYINAHADHTHDHDGHGGDCATCLHIQFAENLLNSLSTAVAATATALGGLFFLFALAKAGGMRFGCPTLVSQKVRLNN
jgi:hypothetical protein